MNLVQSHPEQPSHIQTQVPVAMAFIPVQLWEQPYEPSKGLTQGTIFSCLDKPFFATTAKQGGGSVG